MMSNPTKKTMLKVTMPTMTTVLHREFQTDWSRFPFSTIQVACLLGLLWSSRCCCLLLDWVARQCTGLSSNTLPQECGHVIQTPLCQIIPCRSGWILVRACASDVARPRDSAPRSFRKCACARNPNSLLLVWVFATLQIFRLLRGLCFKAKSQVPGTYMMDRQLIRCSACFETSSVMPCNIRPQPQNMSPGIEYLRASSALHTILNLWNLISFQVAVLRSMNLWLVRCDFLFFRSQ